MIDWELYSADEDGQSLDLVHVTMVDNDVDCPPVICWRGRFFAYQENGGMHVETTPMVASTADDWKDPKDQRIDDLLDANTRITERARAAEALAEERLVGLLACARFTTTLARELKLEGLER